MKNLPSGIVFMASCFVFVAVLTLLHAAIRITVGGWLYEQNWEGGQNVLSVMFIIASIVSAIAYGNMMYNELKRN